MMHGFFLSGLFVLSAYVAPDKEYGLKTPYSLGSLCERATAIVIGVVKSVRYVKEWEKWSKSWGVRKIVNLHALEDIKNEWKDSLLTVKTRTDANFSPFETVLVFVQDTRKWGEFHPWWDRCPWLRGDTMEVAGWRFGKYRIVNDTLRFEQFGIKKFGIPLDIAKGVIKAAIEYPHIVDAKIDTVYEEAMEMLKTKDEDTVRQWVYGELRKIEELVEE